jgi:hypothetical protein
MQLKQESCVAAIDADWARTACSAIVSGVVGRSASKQASKQSSIQVRTRGAGGWRRPKSRRPRLLQMDVFAFSQRPSTTSRGHTRPAVLFAGKCLMSQYAWHCLIYSGAYLFQFARHTALLLKTSSALPAHHCIRQARSAGLDASRFPAIPIPSHGAHCSSRWYRLIFDDQAGWSPATVYALRAHRLRVKLYSNHPLSIASLFAMLLAMHSDTDTVVSAGQRSHFIYPGTLTSETVSECGYSGPYSALRIVSLG